MTPARAKRNSKAPNRFSSDNSQIETSNSAGETIIDYNDNTTSTTHNTAPINQTIKFKHATREPLKVKLPKLKRPQQQQSIKDNIIVNTNNDMEIKIHKIKLPSLASRKAKTQSSNSTPKTPHVPFRNDLAALSKPEPNKSPSTKKSEDASPRISDSVVSTHEKPDVSITSKSSNGEEKSPSMNNSFRSDSSEETNHHMQIVVSQPEPASSSGIRCPCGVNDDLGVMVECERCSTWQHGHCINVGTEEEAYEGYVCAYCIMPNGRARESLYQLTVGDKFQDRLGSSKSTSGNDQQWNIDELSRAIKDLKRVLGSLRAKWRILTSQAYELELRIWQMPVWSEEPPQNIDKEKPIYFMDKCKSNLKLNISNMLKKLEERYRSIHQALPQDHSVRELLNEIPTTVEEYKNLLSAMM